MTRKSNVVCESLAAGVGFLDSPKVLNWSGSGPSLWAVLDCLKCGNRWKHHRVTGRTAYACGNCGNQVYPLAGTIFAKSKGCRNSLHVWIAAKTFLEAKIEGQPRRLDGVYRPVEVSFAITGR